MPDPIPLDHAYSIVLTSHYQIERHEDLEANPYEVYLKLGLIEFTAKKARKLLLKKIRKGGYRAS